MECGLASCVDWAYYVLIIFMEKQGKQEHGIIMDEYDNYVDRICMMYHEHVILL